MRPRNSRDDRTSKSRPVICMFPIWQAQEFKEKPILLKRIMETINNQIKLLRLGKHNI